MNRSIYLSLLGTLFFAPACAPPGTIDCDVSGETRVSASAGDPDAVVTADLQFVGVTTQSEGFAIRSVTVGGLQATSVDFDFASWSVTLPFGMLKTLPAALPAGAPDADVVTVSVPVIAMDACGKSSSTSVMVKVARRPQIHVDTLTMTPQYPGGQIYIPANGLFPLILTLTANPEGAGAQATLSSTAGGTFGGDGAQQTVVLSGDGTAGASATTFFSSTQPGVTVLSASSKMTTSVLPVRVAGPPTLFPSVATLSPGQGIRVTVSTEGAIHQCSATPVADVSVLSGVHDLMVTPTAIDVSGDGKVDIDITVAATLKKAATLTITCSDPFGQFSSGTYAVAP